MVGAPGLKRPQRQWLLMREAVCFWDPVRLGRPCGSLVLVLVVVVEGVGVGRGSS